MSTYAHARRLAGLAAISIVTMTTANAQVCIKSPVASATITSNFGPRLHPVFGTLRPHNGADFRAAMMTPIFAATSGKVTRAYTSGGGGGNTIVIQGDNGVTTHYMHLTRFLVAQGQSVQAGEQIALSGNTGHASTAPHLHFEVRMGGGTEPRDPRMHLCPRPGEVASAGPSVTSEPVQAQTAPSLTGPANQQDLLSSSIAMYSKDAEWKKQVYLITSEMTAYQLISELAAKRMEMRSRIQQSRERFEALTAQVMLANMDAGQVDALARSREALVRREAAK